jgi:uncharacterized protein YaiI (UPF0178 family)
MVGIALLNPSYDYWIFLMQILVDADACPKVIKEVLFRAAERLQIQLTLVANKLLYCPPSKVIRAMQVPHITLAAEVIARGGQVLNPRGEFYTLDTIQERLTMRNFMENLRGSGVETGGPPIFSQRDCQTFANQLDRFLAKRK